MSGCEDGTSGMDEGAEEGTARRYVHLPTAIVAAFGAELSVSDRTQRNRRSESAVSRTIFV